ncbi:MAG TPA: hypothetical protein VMV69_03665 [Pirellulales bacterium]|nr:hypothetical protein [Pirellulales bacterium]
MRQRNAKNGYVPRRHDRRDAAPRYDRAPAVESLRLCDIALAADMTPSSLAKICGGGWSLPSIVELPDGSPGWIGVADVGAVLAWLSRIIAGRRRLTTPRAKP